MEAPTTPQEIKTAYKALYTATANAMDAAQITADRALPFDWRPKRRTGKATTRRNAKRRA